MTEKLTDVQNNWVTWAKTNGANGIFAIYGKTEEDDCKKVLSSIPRFKEEFSGDVICLYAGFEVSRFDANEQMLCMYLFNEEMNKGDWYRLSTSVTFDAKNNRLPLEKTVETLRKVIEINSGVVNWTEILKALICKKFPAWVTEKETSKGVKFFAIASIGSSFEVPKALPIPANVDLGAILKGMSLASPADIPNNQPVGFPAMPSAFPNAAPAAAPMPTTQPATPAATPQTPTQPQQGGFNPFGNV